MKLKYYLRGLGVGIICTAVIMGIAMSGSKKEKLTDAEIIERARILGMVMEDSETDKQSKQEEQKEEEKKKAEEQKKAEAQKKEEEKKKAEEKKKQEEQKKAEEKQKAEQAQTKQELKTIEVLPGEYSDVVSQKLFEAGLIADAAAFNEYLTSSGQDQNIMVGVHQIPMGVSQEEIIKILGEKPE